jgi:hypothetical protein
MVCSMSCDLHTRVIRWCVRNDRTGKMVQHLHASQVPAVLAQLRDR